MPQVPNTNIDKANGTEPNQEIEKNLTKLKVFKPFFKNKPNLYKTQNLMINLRK